MSVPEHIPLPKQKGLTKSFSVREAIDIVTLAHGCTSGNELRRRGVEMLSQSTLGRRREVIRLVLRHVLGCDYETLHINPVAALLADPGVPERRKQELIALLYAANTPLARRGLQDLFLPLLDDAFGVLPGVSPLQWDDWLDGQLQQCTPEVLVKTRNTLVAMLRKFGYLRGIGVHFPVEQRPAPSVFAAAVTIDFQRQGWHTRGLDYVLGPTGPRCLVLQRRDYAAHSIEWAADQGILEKIRVGSDVDIRLCAPDPLGAVAEVMRRAD